MAAKRKMEDMPLEYLVECVVMLEDYTANMLQMILDHHPYMGPAAQQIGQAFQKRHEEIESRYPVSVIATLNGGEILKPH